EIDGLAVGYGGDYPGTARHANQVKQRRIVKGAGRHDPEAAVARDRRHGLRNNVSSRFREPARNRDRRRRSETAQYFERAGEIELGDVWIDHKANVEFGHAGPSHLRLRSTIPPAFYLQNCLPCPIPNSK